MAQVAKDACGDIQWSADARCVRLKGHRGLHWHWRAGRWGSKKREQEDDGGTADTDRLAQRRGKFPDYRIQLHILRRK